MIISIQSFVGFCDSKEKRNIYKINELPVITEMCQSAEADMT